MSAIERRIALRFLFSRRRATCLSILGVACGMAFFILTQAQTTGFERFYIRTILGTSGAIQVHDRFQDTLRTMETAGFHISHRESRRYVEGVDEPEILAAAVREFSNVAAVSEVVSGGAGLRTAVRRENIFVYGIRLDDHLAVTDLDRQIRWGSLDRFRDNPQGALVGGVLAQRLQLQIGDTFQLDTPDHSRAYRVAGIYETGVREIDQSRVYLHLPEARSLLLRPFGASFLQVALRDPNQARADAVRMEASLGHFAYSWQERERAWLEVFRALRFSSGITVASIIFISGLGIFNSLAMMVMEKTREIAVLRSMGYPARSVRTIFFWQGGIILACGILLGWAGGAASTYAVSRIPIRIRGIFSTDYFVVDWSFSHYLMAAAIAALVVAAASFFPARKAARLAPADVFRRALS